MTKVRSSKTQLSKNVLSVAPSATLAISAKAKEMKAQGIDVISLSSGEPDFDTPDHIKQACVKSLEDGATKYTPATGTTQIRQAIADKFKRDQGLNFPIDQIVLSVGAKHAVFNALFALLNPGDEVAIPVPYWLSYPEMVTLLGGKSIFIETDESTSLRVTPAILKKYLTPKTKVLILNSPSNPTGSVYTREELEAIADLLKSYPDLVILSDEIYEKLIFEGKKHISIACVSEEMAERTIIVNGHSKAYSMTGWRLGYAAYPNKEMAKAVSSLQSHSTSNPTTFAQAGGIEALQKGEEDAKKMCAAFEKRRNHFYEKIKAISPLKPFLPQGAFYLFVNISETGMDSVSFCEKLLSEAHVAAVPGKPFGSDQHIRMSFAASDENLNEAAKRIAQWLAKQS